jgi:hypothetical protein
MLNGWHLAQSQTHKLDTVVMTTHKGLRDAGLNNMDHREYGETVVKERLMVFKLLQLVRN